MSFTLPICLLWQRNDVVTLQVYLNPNGLKYHLEKGTCKIEPESEDNSSLASSHETHDLPLPLSSPYDIDWDQDSETSTVTHDADTGASNSATSETHTHAHVQGQPSRTDIAMSLSSSLSVPSHPLTLLTSPLASPLSSLRVQQSTVSTNKTVEQHESNSHVVSHEYPQQTTTMSNDFSDTSSSDGEDGDESEGDNSRGRTSTANTNINNSSVIGDSKKLHMPVPQVAADFWRVDVDGF
ncbi:hypothetical protein K435DRAFT_849184 [Dendrothele bispora CBS 962.96]|uniref:Uncharacterized protein n=1 Tax=Dendrothele bispora (strain CBS 962.96) TaxID=1314807 RepID=A0A4S8MTP6_DENBC|nr:hypothetical protein K435DRAFT_849184 [Dendrothele bispora CBS 962.96]